MTSEHEEQAKKDTSSTEEELTSVDSPEIEAGDDRLQELADEVAEYKDKHLRAVAEMENMRRRTEKERGDLLKYAAENISRDMLPVLDSMDKALSSSDQEQTDGQGSSVTEGVKLIHQQLIAVLKKHGIEAIEAHGQPFDPNLHQAIQRVEVEEDLDGEQVHQEFAKGYTIHGRLLRASVVSVAVSKAAQ